LSIIKGNRKSESLLNDQQVRQYLARIRCPLEIKPNLKYLNLLHRQHLLNVPFENLDNFLGFQVLLDIEKIFSKILLRRRGGFCYELNALFYHLLLALGYDAQLVSARVYHSNERLGPEFDHMAIIVNLSNDLYLVDVGFGESFRNSKKIQPESIHMDFNQFYKVTKSIDDIYFLHRSDNSIHFTNLYQFTLSPRTLIEFIDMCHFHHKNKASHLVKKIYVHQIKKTGQLILTGSQLTIEENGQVEKIPIHNKDEFIVKLKQHFGLDFKRNF